MTGASTSASLPLKLSRWTGSPMEPWWLSGLVWLTLRPHLLGRVTVQHRVPLQMQVEAQTASKLKFNSANISIVTSVFIEGENQINKTECLPWKKGSIYVFVKALLRYNSYTIGLMHLLIVYNSHFLNVFTELYKHDLSQFWNVSITAPSSKETLNHLAIISQSSIPSSLY